MRPLQPIASQHAEPSRIVRGTDPASHPIWNRKSRLGPTPHTDYPPLMNRVALITGASRGIGRGIALELARLGWNLVVNYARNAEAAAETTQACIAAAQGRPIRVLPFQADIAVSTDRSNLVEFTEQSVGPIALLVNNAGVAPLVRADLLDATEESLDRLLTTNLKGPFLLTQLVARRMISTNPPAPEGESGIGGRKIVFISSISAYTASVNRGDYCVSKAGVGMLTQLFAARLAEHGIGVFEIRPGIIATDMTHAVQAKYDALIRDGLTPIRRWGTPADVGKAVAAIASDMLPFSTGEVINVDGGFHLRTL